MSLLKRPVPNYKNLEHLLSRLRANWKKASKIKSLS